MRLRQLRLYNYRSFGDATVDLEDVTLLTGPNNAGKSMLLDAVRCLLSDPAEQDPDQKKWNWSDLAPHEPTRLGHGFEMSGVRGSAPVRIVGIFDSLLEDERVRYQRFLVSGCLQLGVWMEPGREGHVLGETRYFVLPDGHEAAAGPVGRRVSMFARDWNAILFDQQREVWRPYLEDWSLQWTDPLALDGDETFSFPVPPLPAVVDFPGPDRASPSVPDLLGRFMEGRIDDLVASLPDSLTQAVEQLTRQMVDELGTKLNDAAPDYLSDSARVVLSRGSHSQLRDALLASVGNLRPLTRCVSRHYVLQRPRGLCRTLSRMASLQVRDSVELLAATCE